MFLKYCCYSILLASTIISLSVNASLIKVVVEANGLSECLSIDLTEVKDCGKLTYKTEELFEAFISFDNQIPPESLFEDSTYPAGSLENARFTDFIDSVDVTMGNKTVGWNYQGGLLSGVSDVGNCKLLQNCSGDSVSLYDSSIFENVQVFMSLLLRDGNGLALKNTKIENLDSKEWDWGSFSLQMTDLESDLLVVYGGTIKSITYDVPEPKTAFLFLLIILFICARERQSYKWIS